MPWDRAALDRVPRVYRLMSTPRTGSRRCFTRAAYQGKPTRVFATTECRTVCNRADVNGIVLVHGGGGSAFVLGENWNSRGYAAIAMDSSARSAASFWQRAKGHVRHAWAGPPGGRFRQGGRAVMSSGPITPWRP
jgi:alpha-beta hydrolase superfamily lysophospholipase